MDTFGFFLTKYLIKGNKFSGKLFYSPLHDFSCKKYYLIRQLNIIKVPLFDYKVQLCNLRGGSRSVRKNASQTRLEETLFTFPFSRMDQVLAMCPDGGTIYFFFFLCASFQLFGRKTLKIQSQLSIKPLQNFNFIEFTILLMKQMLLFSNRAKFPANSLKLNEKATMLDNSK